MGASLRVVVKPEGVEATQAAIQAIARSAAASTQQATSSMSSAAVTHADAMEHRYAKASLRITEAMGRVADSGNLAGHGMGKILSIGSEMAFMFGTTGPIVGAIGVTALTITRFFTTARDESEKTKQKLKDDVAALVNTGNVGGVEGRLRDLMMGTPGNRYQDGIAASDSTIAGMRGRSNPLTQAIVDGMIKREQERTKAMREEARMLTDALLNPARAPGGVGGVGTARIEAKRREDDILPMQLWSNKEAAAQYGQGLRELAEQRNPKWAADAGTKASTDEMAKKFTDDLVKSIQEMFEGGEGARILKSVSEGLKKTIKTFKWSEIKSDLATGIASSVSGGLAIGIQSAIASGSLRQAFTQLGQFISGQLGKILADVALKALGFAELMAKFETWLIANPWAAIGIAAAMVGLAAAFQSGGSVGSGGGGGGFGGGAGSYGSAIGSAETTRLLWGADSSTVAAGLTPKSATQVVVIGTDDPSAQRKILELIRKGERRG